MRSGADASGGTEDSAAGGDLTNARPGASFFRRRARFWKVAAGIAILLALILVGRGGLEAVPPLLERIRSLGPWAPAAFVGLYAVATVAWVPGSILTLAAGAIFGLMAGTLYALIGATLGATLAFLVGRHLARAAVERRLGASRKLRAVDEAVAHEGGRVVFLLRLSPVFPFNALNYALGLTRVRLRAYVAASAIGMVPGTFMYVYAGFAAGRIAAGTAGAEPQSVGQYVLLAVGLLATVGVIILVTRSARAALARSAGLAAEDG